MRVLLLALSRQERVLRNSSQEIFIRDIMKMANFMVLENISGKMVVFTRGSSDRGKSTAMEYGGKEIATRNTKASFSKIESKDMAYILGPMEISTRETTMPI
jgi:hypothetical protein